MEKGRILVGGGQDFYGPTAERDRRVCELLPTRVYALVGDQVQIVTGGTEGIPDIFATHWPGTTVLDVVSDEYLDKYRARVAYQSNRSHIVVGKTQLARRLAMTAMDRVVCAVFIQGGKFSSHELQLLHAKSIPIVPLWGGGGAAGGQQPYEGWSLPKEIAENWKEPLLLDTDPSTEPFLIAEAMVRCIAISIKNAQV